MKTIILDKTNTTHVCGNLYKWIPQNDEPYNLVVSDGIDIDTRGGNIDTDGGNIDTRGGFIDTRGGFIYTDGGDIKCGKLYWQSMQRPDVGVGKIEVSVVLPEEVTREHWVERLGGIVDVSSGCYEELLGRVRPHLDEILALDKWSRCERWIIESWRE